MDENKNAETLDKGKRHWYVIHTYSGYENKVSTNLERKGDKIFHIMIPMENEVVADENGNKRVVTRKVFPGYVLVEMIIDDRTWYIVRNTPGVTGFVGPDNKQPVPLSDEEVRHILAASVNGQELQEETEEAILPKAKPQINLQLQQRVRLKTGPFANFEGIVSAIDRERGKLKVLVDMFGRETPVDIDYTQVEEIE